VNDFGRIRLGEWLSRVEKTAKSADSRAISRRKIESHLNGFAYHERVEETPEIKGSWRWRRDGACLVPASLGRSRGAAFRQK